MASGPAGFSVEGATNLRRTLRRAADDLDDLTRPNTQAASIAARAGSRLAPRRSGRLASSLHSSGTKDTGLVTSSLPYAGPIHWGWRARNIAPQPFLSDGAQNTQGQWFPVYEAALDRAIQKVRGA